MSITCIRGHWAFTDEQDVQKYSEIADRIQDTIDFMDAAGITADTHA